MLDTKLERLLFLHLQPAVIGGLLCFAGILLLFRVFRVRNPSVRFFLLMVPLVRPLIALVLCTAYVFPRVHGLANDVANAIGVPNHLHFISADVGLESLYLEESETIINIPQGIVLILLFLSAAALLFFSCRWTACRVYKARLYRQSCDLAPTRQAWLKSMVEHLSSSIGLKDPPRILTVKSSSIFCCVIGCHQPLLVVNADAPEKMEARELQIILAHELMHIRRRDSLWRWVTVLLRDIQFFNPVSHWSLKRLAVERERACDREAIEVTKASPRLMASCLVKVSRLLITDRRRPSFAMSSFLGDRNSILEERVRHLLEMEEGAPATGPVISPPRRRGLRTALLVLLWLALVLVQVDIFLVLGGYPLVIR